MNARHSDPYDERGSPRGTELIVSRPEDVRVHVQAIMESPEFRRSHRSCEFLQFLVDKKLTGELDGLKERMIGVHLFGRDPSYDTGEDAIVRVTATDVRRRLKRFYEKTETSIRIELPLGSYVIVLSEQTSPVEPRDLQAPSAAPPPTIGEIAPSTSSVQALQSNVSRHWWRLMAGMAMLGVLLAVGWQHVQETRPHLLPWSAMHPHQGKLKIVFSDPDIVTLQGIVGSRITLADYASHHYLPSDQVSPPPSADLTRLFHGNNVPVNDAKIALNVRNLFESDPIETYPARVLQSQDFATDDNFVLLGSPLSNPWVALFQDRLDFYFQYDPKRREEVVYNRHAGPGELPVYAPTLPGWGTGQSYAIVALSANPNESGRILIVAGSNAAATDAAGRLVTNVEAMARMLQEHGVDAHNPRAQFELLLRVNTMASSLSTYDVVACHHLS